MQREETVFLKWQTRFGTEKACVNYLLEERWGMDLFVGSVDTIKPISLRVERHNNVVLVVTKRQSQPEHYFTQRTCH